MSGECVEMTPRVRIPQTDSVVLTSTREGGTIGTKRDGDHPIRMPIERAEFTPCVRIPETDGAIPTPASDSRPIGTKR